MTPPPSPLPSSPPHPPNSASDPIPVYPPSTTSPSSLKRPHQSQSSPQQHQQLKNHAHPTASQRETRHQQNIDGQAHPRPNGGPQQRFGQYAIIKTLGEGSFGKVKLAVHQVTGQKVALKIISRKKLTNRDMAGRVEREIQYLQLLRHPHIIKL